MDDLDFKIAEKIYVEENITMNDFYKKTSDFINKDSLKKRMKKLIKLNVILKPSRIKYSPNSEIYSLGIKLRNQIILIPLDKYKKHEEIIKKPKEKLKRHGTYQDTSIELKIRQFLRFNSIEYEVQRPIKGTPDIFIEPDICIFADGCYWHGCNLCMKRKNQQKYFKQSLRDNFVTKFLIKNGFRVFRFWEHDINNNFDEVEKQILSAVVNSENNG